MVAAVHPTGQALSNDAFAEPKRQLFAYAGRACGAPELPDLHGGDLYAVIGTTFGGTGSTFNIPDLQGRVAVGLGTNASVNALGLSDNQTTVANRRPHHRTSSNLALSDPGHAHYGYSSSNQVAGGSASPAWATPGGNPTSSNTTGISLTGSIGTGNANDALDTPSFLVVNYIIKT